MDDYKKYRWFYTSNKTLVVGGKNAQQNDELLRDVLSAKKDYYVMHTSSPGSPFSIMLKDRAKISEKEIDECAIFTGCFSRAWREGKKKAIIDIFTTAQLSKTKEMKAGMWQVKNPIKRVGVELKLALAVQRGILRAVPVTSTEKVLMIVCPGSVDKRDMAAKLGVELGDKHAHDEIIAALPAGNVRKCI